MRLNIKKISALGMSLVMTGLTAGTAMAANFPAPFVDNGSADVAVLYGTGTGVSALDQTSANNIQSALSAAMPSGSVTVDGGEAFMLEKTSNKFNFNNALNAVYSTLDKDEMDFLADGEYDDGDVESDYDQTMTLGSKTLNLFADTDYNNKEPTVGFRWTNGETILSYTIDFDEDIPYADLVDTDMPLLGNSYYVLSVTNGSAINVLDTAQKNTAYLNEAITVGDYNIEVTYVSSNDVKFKVNGEVTESLNENEEYELSDGSYIVATDIFYQDYAGGTQGAEFSIGEGKIELLDGEEAELNTEDIDGLEVTLTDGSSSQYLSSITLTWKSDDETFLTEGDSLSMPGFGVVQLAYGGMSYEGSAEEISIDSGETLTLNMGNYDLPVAWYDSTTDAALGEEDKLLKLTVDSSHTYAEAGYTNGTTPWWVGSAIYNTSVIATDALNVSEDNRFLVTRIDTDLTDLETAYYELTNIDVDDSSDWVVELEDLIGDNDMTFDAIGDTDDQGDLTFTLKGFSSDNSSAIFNVTATSGTVTYNKAVSEKGLVVTMPTDAAYYYNGTGATLTFTEANKDEDVNAGSSFTVTAKNNTNDNLHVSTHSLTSVDEETSDDVYMGYVQSDLATMFTFDKSADEYEFTMDYHGKEATADVQVVAGGTVSSSSNPLGNVVMKDTELDTVKSKNLIVVGGSCINSAAADILGGSYCGPSFTEMTGVGAGEFMIKSYADKYTSGKVALLVAGYQVEDTTAASTYLTKKMPDTSSSLKGVSNLNVESITVTEM